MYYKEAIDIYLAIGYVTNKSCIANFHQISSTTYCDEYIKNIQHFKTF